MILLVICKSYYVEDTIVFCIINVLEGNKISIIMPSNTWITNNKPMKSPIKCLTNPLRTRKLGWF